jgi:acyl-CoA hydrolase
MINKLEAVHSFTVMPKDCNFNKKITGSNDILFGGKLMYEMDYAGAKVVRRALYDSGTDTCVTASTDKINFERPSFIGDIVTMVATIKALGRSSIQVRVKVTREDLSGKIESICSANMTFVSLKDGKPFPHHLNFDDLVTNQT